MVDGRKLKETAALTEVLHGGTNEGESPDDDVVVYAMHQQTHILSEMTCCDLSV